MLAETGETVCISIEYEGQLVGGHNSMWYQLISSSERTKILADFSLLFLFSHSLEMVLFEHMWCTRMYSSQEGRFSLKKNGNKDDKI